MTCVCVLIFENGICSPFLLHKGVDLERIPVVETFLRCS